MEWISPLAWLPAGGSTGQGHAGITGAGPIRPAQQRLPRLLVRVVINPAQADLRKEGPSFDLPIALALLVASGQLDRPQLEGLWCAGELGRDGSLRPCRGVIALAEQTQQQKAQALVVPPEKAQEASLIEGLTICSAANLRTRSSLQLLRMARTIADLNDTTSVDRNAVAEASCFRCTDLLKQPGVQ